MRYVLAWHAPELEGTGTRFTGGSKYTRMYAAHYPDSAAVATFLAQNHAALLARILAWQEVLYREKSLPGWLTDSLINNLYLFPECSIWGQAFGHMLQGLLPLLVVGELRQRTDAFAVESYVLDPELHGVTPYDILTVDRHIDGTRVGDVRAR